MSHRILLTLLFLCAGIIVSAQKFFSVVHECQADVKVFVADAEYKADLKECSLQTKDTEPVGKRITRNL